MNASRHLTNHVFATFTFKRDIPVSQCWEQTSLHFNRYIQRLRRLHNSPVQYLRTVEAHGDTYPHLHAILQFRNPITVENTRYFDRILYAKWKQLWTGGISDYQPPLSTKRHSILYIVKYISKDTPTYRTLWRKLLQNVNSVVTTENSSETKQNTESTTSAKPAQNTIEDSEAYINTKPSTTLLFCKKYKIKQLTWSRDFTFPMLQAPAAVPKGQETLSSHVYN